MNFREVPLLVSGILLCILVVGVTEDVHGRSWKDLLHLAHAVSQQEVGMPDGTNRGQDSAIGLALNALAELDEQNPDNDSAQCAILNRMADFQIIKGDIKAATELLEHSIDLCSGQNRMHLLREDAVHRVGLICVEHPGMGPVSSVCEEGTALRDSLLTSPRRSDIPRLFRLSYISTYHARWDEFHDLMREIIDLGDSPSDNHSEYVIHALIYLAENQSKPDISNVGSSSAHQDSAVALGERALALAEEHFGAQDTLYAYCAARLGDYYSRLGQLSRTVELWEKAWEINRQALPPSHIEYQGGLLRVAGINRVLGQYDKAVPFYRLLLKLRIQTQGDGHPEVAGMHKNLARVLLLTGQFDEAEEHLYAALTIHENAFERIQSDIAQTHRRLGHLNFQRGDYVQAESHFLESIDLEASASPSSDARLASCKISLANLYGEWNRANEAEQLLTEALSLQEGFLGSNHPDLGNTLVSIAEVQLAQSRFEEADANIERARSLWPPEDTYLASALAGYHFVAAKSARKRGSYASAVKEMALGLSYLSTVYDSSDYRVIPYLAELAEGHSLAGDISQAEHALDRALAINQSLYRVFHPFTADLFEVCARHYQRQGRSVEAIAFARNAFDIRRRNLIDGALVMSERDALQTASLMQSTRDLVVTFADVPESDISTIDRDLAETILRSKGVVSEVLLYRHREQIRKTDASVMNLRDTLRFEQAALSQLYSASLRLDRDASYVKVLERKSQTVEALKKRLARNAGDIGVRHSFQNVDYDDIARTLPEGSTLLEYLRCRVGGTDRYFVLVVQPNLMCHLANLGTAETIDSAVAMYNEHFATLSLPPSHDDVTQYRRVMGSLQELVWNPITGIIGESDLVFVSPDAHLNLISWSGFVNNDGGYLLEKLAVHYLSSGRDLLQVEQSSPGNLGLMAFGDPAFDAPVSARLAALIPPNDGELGGSSQPSPLLGMLTRSDCWRSSLIDLPRLSGTRTEVETIGALWSKLHDEPVQEHVGLSASEEAVKQLSPGHRVLHFATHGHFPEGDCRTQHRSEDEPNGNRSHDNTPLLMSGLCLAGLTNEDIQSSDPGVEDGLLTAEEIASLDLTGTEMVVLSACETGTGSIRTNEGVFGVRRAFQMAGAQTIVSSLWRVSDQATMSLMEHLYLHSKKPIVEALRSAELEALANLRDRKQPDHPYYWAGFISTGDWR